ncbi:MAG: hypothetical protein HS126_17335 [Anaerolineales bacterium]|nr:hypothetical protein [Anaerolineales bacterium]
MTDELRRQFSKFLEYVAEALDISETHYKDAENRYQALCHWLGREASTVAAFDPDMYPQGSFRLGTVIKPISDEEEYDIDFVCELNFTKDKITQKKLKELIGYEIKRYAKANNMDHSPEDHRRCWRINLCRWGSILYGYSTRRSRWNLFQSIAKVKRLCE